MARRVTALAAAGCLSVGPEAIALLSEGSAEDEIRLCDGHPERLDLAFQLFQALVERVPVRPRVRASGSLAEALDGCTHALLSLEGDAARRLIPSPPEAVEIEDPEEVYAGDMNRPTPAAQLSPATRAMMNRPYADLSEVEAIRRALGEAALGMPREARVLVLTPGVEPPAGLGWELRARPQVTEDMAIRRPHQILRWIQGEPTLHELRAAAEQSAVADWLQLSS